MAQQLPIALKNPDLRYRHPKLSKEKIENYLKQGNNSEQISKITGYEASTIRKWYRIYDINYREFQPVNNLSNNLVGKKFGNLTVIKRIDNIKSGKYSHVAYECQCDCGGKIIRQRRYFTQDGNFKLHCGCKDITKEDQEKSTIKSLIKILYAGYIAGAIKRNKSFNLKIEDFKRLISNPCEYCGTESSNIMKSQGKLGTEYKYNGIDRVDNKIGYELDNCVSCCIKCNKAKSYFGQDEFLNHIKKIYKHSIEK